MSGAFNIDIEVGKADGKNNIKIYCWSLTQKWEVVKSIEQLTQFYKDLQDDQDIKRNKIGLGDPPALNPEDKKDFSMCQMFLSRMGCTSAVLRVSLFHEFLEIPKDVCDGLAYAQLKPFGKTLREGYMTRIPRKTRKALGKRYLRLTREDRGGSLVSYKTEEKKMVLASFKIGQSTEIKVDRKKPNALVLTSGQRQWTIQASKPADFDTWRERLGAMLEKFGSKLDGDGSKEKNKEQDKAKRSDSYNNALEKNIELKQRLDFMYGKMEGMTQQLEKLKSVNADLSGGNNAMKVKVNEEFEKEKFALVKDYKMKINNLEEEIDALNRRIAAKTAMDSSGGAKSKLKSLGNFLKNAVAPEELESQIDAEKKILDTFTEDDRQDIKFMHRHLHQHEHVHNHTHRHIHLHADAADNVDNVDVDDITRENSHKISHTISHSNTQFRIEGNNTFF